MSLGERITELRIQKEMSQYQLAENMSVSRQAVSKWENDLTLPDAQNLILLADILETDIEYLTTGRRTYGRRPPVVIKTTEIVEKVVEKPIYIEKVIEKEIPKQVVEYVEKPVLKKVIRVKYIRNPIEFLLVAGVFFFIGLVIGMFL